MSDFSTSEANSPAGWTDGQWATFIQARVDQTLVTVDGSSDTESAQKSGQFEGPLSTIVTPSDKRFPLAIDHTLLKPDATPEQVDKLCDEAVMFGFKSCCVNGIYVKRVADRLRHAEGSNTIPCCVVGFPLGASTAESIAAEAKQAILDGAREVDTVFPVGLILSPSPPYSSIYHHLRTIVLASHPYPVKVILETFLLPTPQLKIAASVLSTEAGAAFVKTCTGFNGGGATRDDVRLMSDAVRYKDGKVKVKASGGVRTFEACREMFEAGAERIGTSSGVSIMTQAQVSSAVPA